MGRDLDRRFFHADLLRHFFGGNTSSLGADVTPDEAWPDLLARRTGWVVVNGGVNGDTGGAALQ